MKLQRFPIFLLLIAGIHLCQAQNRVELRANARMTQQVATYKVVQCCWCTDCDCNRCATAIVDTVSSYSLKAKPSFAVAAEKIKLLLYDETGRLITSGNLDLQSGKLNKVNLQKYVDE